MHYDLVITGRVQGVGFRFSAKAQADLLQLTGWVANADDGSVSIEVEGEQANLKLFVEWCHRGPNYAKVVEVKIQEGILKHFTNFEIV